MGHSFSDREEDAMSEPQCPPTDHADMTVRQAGITSDLQFAESGNFRLEVCRIRDHWIWRLVATLTPETLKSGRAETEAYARLACEQSARWAGIGDHFRWNSSVGGHSRQ